MINRQVLQTVDLMLRARHPLLYIVAGEEEPIEALLDVVTQQSSPPRSLKYWDMARGWQDNGSAKGNITDALDRIAQSYSKENCVFVLKDVYPFLEPPVTATNLGIIRELRHLARALWRSRSTIVLLSHTLVLPDELKEQTHVIYYPLPLAEEIDYLIRQTVAPDKLKLRGLGWEQLIKACQGLSLTRIQRVLARCLAAKQHIDEADIDEILAEKQAAIRQTEFLEFYSSKESLKNVGGLANLKQWVRTRRDAFTEEARSYGIPHPKGLLLVGIQGTGKSLSAKTIAYEWRLPLLRLDVGRLFGSYVGESEERTRRMIQLAEAVAPCVLWIDEIDKGFGGVTTGIDGDSGTSRRVLGTLLTWMQEKQSPVFIVATANNVSALPAELLRRGRFDEIFFLSLPTATEREEIFRVHIQRLRPSRLREFDLSLLAQRTANFSGAEIEQVILDAMHIAFSRGTPGQRQDFTTADIVKAIEETVPLARIAAEQITMLKGWVAQTGARLASNDPVLEEELRRYRLEQIGYY
ncbi:MAG: AAA family ATPase [Pseudanabaenaceae cyanobacterium SKYGB_i_bin29]|nr:AAA family ATPase [Pseudanabaenaceae cyanobacterium SKYG29]MDW8421118.1 AAA family ATPase [Pseudanabaenaceae cyanobacterium SKYGB_i_bin29]